MNEPFYDPADRPDECSREEFEAAMKIDDGGPAFPNTAKPMTGEVAEWGMSLRDWFAGNERIHREETFGWEVCEALAGPRPEKDQKTDPIGWEIWQATWQAKIRFIRADAMLAARKEGA